MADAFEEMERRIRSRPGAEERRRQMDDQADEGDFLETFPGELYTALKARGEREGVHVSVERFRMGRTVYHYGDESALLQVHIEPEGLATPFTTATDLQRPWWREVFLDEGKGGKIEEIGLIAPSVTEMLSAHSSPDIVQKFGLKNLLAAAGKSVEGLEDEHLESDVHGADESYGSRVVEELAAFWKPLVYPDFDIQFNNGKGDIWRRLRLVPLTKGGTTDLVKGGDLGKSATQKIVDNYDQLVDHLRGVSF